MTDFKLGYSPERINPGDKTHTLANIIKVVSGCDADSLDEIAKVYELLWRPAYIGLLYQSCRSSQDH